jgi:hypothetical protein
MYVEPVMLADHLRQPRNTSHHIACSVCLSPMTRVLYRDLGHDREWLFWRCSGDPDHVTCALPLPTSRPCG